jgi:L-lactate dehydrogenase complex protein LldG
MAISSSHETFLQRVQQALREGNRPGDTADLPPRGATGYQGAGPDPVAHFAAQLTAAGGKPYVVADREAAVERALELVRSSAARTALLGHGAFIDTLGLADPLRAAGIDVTTADSWTAEKCREPFFAADIGITGVDFLIAETGSVIVQSRPGEPRSFSLLPPVHIAIAHQAQIMPDLFDLFTKLGSKPADTGRLKMPSCLTLITGPSKTGDIELRLVTGVHGPGEIHVIIVTG